MEETLNLRTVTVRDRVDDGDGKYHYMVNKAETMLAREKQNQMKEAYSIIMKLLIISVCAPTTVPT